MAFDNETRGKLQRFVTDIRALLTEDFTRQLQQTYGMDPASGVVAPIESLKHLDDERLETAQILRDVMDHYMVSEAKDEKQTRASVLQRIAREQAFTILNRLAALRMMEARGILLESIGQGTKSEAFRLYQQVANSSLGDTGETHKYFLNSLFDLFTADLPSLFDRYSPQSRLFPREVTLTKALDLINGDEIEPLWAEDETIGWIYQYFNSKEERKAMRDASQAPRNSRELAVRNQFFTPRYVVEFLVDNTLGRLWFNWTGGQTDLRDRCQYLLVKPDEQPEAAERLRDPRTIKLLDPACGSMHFGLYAFDLFLEIYREAWAWEQTQDPGCLVSETGGSADLKPLSQTYADQDAFLHDVPRLIIEHNIYGVDIDPRAAQIASLALWLRAQRAWHEAGVKAKDRPHVGRGHVVAAVAPPAEVDLRKRFMEELDPLDAELFEKTLFLLKGLPELGVLLQVEKELPALVRRVFGEHGDLFREADMVRWQKAEVRLQEALTEFARAARSTYQGRLFAEDALQGLRMIDHCREVFDVVVMNPPFGALASGTKTHLVKAYPNSKNDLLAIFVERGVDLMRAGGRLGAITSRACFFLPSYKNWREHVLIGSAPPKAISDLGLGVMDDAMVEAAAYVLEKN
jgi:type I restriction-modification system DNA methylase subunit